MIEKRTTSRHRVLKSAFIVISEKAPKLECTVRNISESGAALQVSTTIGIPQHFDVIVDAASLPFGMADRHQNRRCI